MLGGGVEFSRNKLKVITELLIAVLG
jgi:hypothetical protein